MEFSESISVSTNENEDFSKDLLHTSVATEDAPAFTTPTLNSDSCEITTTTATLPASTCLVNASPSVTSSKAAPFCPRVLVGTQPSASPVGTQNLSIPVLSEPERLSQQIAQLSNISLPPFTCQTSAITTSQFFPLILTAPPANSNPSLSTSNPVTPVHVQVNAPCSTPSSTTSSSPSPLAIPICAPPQNISTLSVKPNCTNGSSTNCSVVGSTAGRNAVSIVSSLAPVVISPQIANSVASAFTLRFAPPTTLHCTPLTAAPSTSFLFETPVLSSQLTPTTQLQQSVPVSTQSSIRASGGHATHTSLGATATSTGTSVSLLMSSGLCPAPRVLIHKSTGLPSVNQALSSGSGDPYSLTLVTAPIRASDSSGTVGQLNAYAVPCTTSEQPASSLQSSTGHSPLHTPPKAKLVSLTTPVSANVRLYANPSATVPHMVKCTNATGTYTASLTNTFSNATIHSVVSPVKTGCTGLWTSLSGSNGVTPSSLVALQSPQPLIVQTAPDLITLPPTGAAPNSHVSSLRHVTAVTTGSPHSTASLSLPLTAPSAPSPTVLAFSLSTTAPSAINVSGAGVLTQPASGIRHSGTTNPLVVRASGTSAMVNTSTGSGTAPSVSSLTSASLLKPFSLSLPGSVSTTPSYFYTSVHSSCASPSSGASVPQVVPINIAPARLPTLATSLAVSSPSASVGTMRSQLHSAMSSCILSPRHNLTSVFSNSSSASNRKRARKQQLASAFSTTTASTTITTSTTTMTTTTATGLTVVPCSASIAVSPTISTTAKSNSAPATLTAIPLCSSGASIPLAQISPIPGRTGQAVAPTIVAIPKPILQPAPHLNPAALPIQPLTTVSPRPCTSISEPLQLKFPNNSFVSSVCVTTCTCHSTSLNTVTTATPTTSTPGGYVGIRLLSVRPNPTSLTSTCPTSLATNAEAINTLPTGVSGLITRLGPAGISPEITSVTTAGPSGTGAPQLRLSACTTTPEVTHTQTATVYVLTTSNAYPVLPPCTSSAMVSASAATTTIGVESHPAIVSQFVPTTATSSTAPYGTGFMMSGAGSGPGIVQVRLRPPLTMTTSTTNNGNSALLGAMSTNSSSSTITPPLVLDTGHGSARLTGPIASNATQTVVTSSPSELTIGKTRSPHSCETTPTRLTALRSCASLTSTNVSSTSSLLHRHLLSPQNPVHNEHISTDERARLNESGSGLSTPLICNSVDLFSADRASSRTEPTSTSDSTTMALRNRDIDSHCSGRLKHSAYGYRATENHLRITAAADLATEEAMSHLEDDDDEEGYDELSCLNEAKLHVSDALRLPRKRLKLDDTVKSIDEQVLNDEQLLLLLKSKVLDGKTWSTQSTSANGMPLNGSGGTIRLAIDPVDGCEWVLNGLPAKPSIIPKWMTTTSRSSTVWRAKATHFLSPSEIRTKQDSRWESSGSIRRDLSGKFSHVDRGALTRTRRHQRTLSRRASLDRASDNGSTYSSSSKRPSTIGSAERRLLHDIIALRLQQSELQLVRFPLCHTSVLNISGWRVFSCANNLDLLVFSEHRSLQSIGSLHVSLRDWLNPMAMMENKCLSESSSHVTTCSNRPSVSGDQYGTLLSLASESSESVSTATVLSSLSSIAGAPALVKNQELATQAERALDLILGICQRKRYLLDSLQRLHGRSQRIVEQFRNEALALFDEMEQEQEEREQNSQLRSINHSTPSPPLPTSSATKTTCVNPSAATTTTGTSGSGRSTPMHVRRSARTCSPHPHSLKRFRSRDSVPDLVEESALSAAKSSGTNSLLNSNCTKTALLCNGEVSGCGHASRR